MKRPVQQSIAKRLKVAARAGQRDRAAGVSMVELLVVVAILLVILAMAVPRMMASRQSAQQVAAVALLKKLHAAQELHYIVHSQYAATFAELDGLTAGLQDFSRQPEFLRVRLPLRNTALPTLAFLMLPSPEQDTPFQGNGPNQPRGLDQSANGGNAPGAPPPSGSGSNPAAGSGAGGSSGNGAGAPKNSPGSGSTGPSGGSGAGSGGGSSAPAGNWSKADRLTWQGYEFRLERPTPHTWRVLAMPVQDEHAGNHYFLDQSGTIRREYGRPAGAQSAPL